MIQTHTVDLLEIDLDRAMWGLVAIALVADIATTAHGLEAGLTESNPIASDVIDGYGMAGMVVMKLGTVCLALACRTVLEKQYRAIVPAALAAPWLVAVCLNVYLIGVVA
ncbi:DUF5658 family protein [Natronosalvus rutilus]|uniref:DUF5658 family protein n=1 Tax=Natronosalvus rutilus TaxID=2953753 RepID=A0A9E7SSP2_9EURY|nr:DUF5658 family protein [Natronosalvus rutilus]UTF52779.1 DUF5658 family protein [Natronosalvus rutilus]